MKLKRKHVTDKISPFVWLDAVNQKNSDPMAEHGEKAYPAFMVNRGLSYFADTVLHAAEINLYQDLDPRLAYDYYMEALRPKRRISKWGKKREASSDVEMVMEAFNYSWEKAASAVSLLRPEELEAVREYYRLETEN